MFSCIEEQIGRLTNFLSDAQEDIAALDEKLQEKVIKYRNKQCGKAAIFGIVIGVAATFALQAIF